MKKLLLVLVLIAVGLGISSCKRTEIADPPVDVSTSYNVFLEGALDIAITAPAPNAVVSETTVAISAVAAANTGIAEVDCYVDNSLIGTLTESTSSTYTFSWDSSMYENGSHAIKMTAVDKLGASVSDTIQVTLKNADSPPVVAIIYPSDGENIILPHGSAITIQANATDNKNISNVSLFINGILVHKNMSHNGTLYQYNWTPPADGPYTLYVIAYDTIKQATKSAEVKVTINGKVTVAIMTPAPNATVSGSEVAINALALSPENGISRVDYYIDYIIVGTQSSGSNNTYAFTWDSTSVANGSHVIKVTAVDTKGLFASAAINVTVNNQGAGPVTVSILTPAPNATVSGTAVAINVLALSDDGISRVDYYIDNIIVGTQSSGSNNTYAFTWDSTSVANGSHVIRVTAFDTKGLFASAAINVTVNNLNPGLVTVSITAPAAGAIVSGTVPITVLATAGSGINKVDCYIDDKLIDSKPGSTTSNSYSFSWNSAQYSNGSHTIKVTAYDEKGASASGSVTVTVNNAPTDSPPVVALIYPLNNTNIAAGKEIIVLANAEDDKGIDHVDLYINDVWQAKTYFDGARIANFQKKYTMTSAETRFYVIAWDTIGQKTVSNVATVNKP